MRQPPVAFSNASLLALAVSVLRERDPALVPAGFASPDPMQSARASESDKTGLLEHALVRGGPEALLSIGQSLERLRPSPTVDVLTASPDVRVLADKWNRLARYHHARNRADMRVDGQSAVVHRYAISGPPPSPSENLFVAGLLVGLIALLPVERVQLHAGSWTVSPPDWSPGIDPGAFADFTLSWESDAHRPVESNTSDGTTSSRLERLLSADLCRGWQIDAAARELALSSRSLQRRLAAEGMRFSAELRRVRIVGAGRMLSQGEAPLAEIGYCCGFSDQAHFQREFARVTNLTPGEYRRISAK